MPWCDPCSTFHSPADAADGQCPTCGEVMTIDEEHNTPEEAATVGQSAPWHFWLVVVALAGYLIWRFVDFVAWLF